jgi:hemoglobin
MFTSTLAGFMVLSVSGGQCGRPAPVYPGPGMWGPPPAVRYWQRPVTGPVVTPYMPVVQRKEAPAKEKSLYERLGGEDAIKAVVDDFVGRAAGNPKVNFTRKGTPAEWKPTPEGIDHLKKMLVELVGSVTGGPQKYSGRGMKEVHKGMMITQDEFDALAGDLKATLDKFKVPAKEQEELLKIVASTAPDIVEKKK